MKNALSLILAGCFVGCDMTGSEFSTVFSISYDFSVTDQGWTGDFADYPQADSIAYELIFKHDTLPANLSNGGTKKGLMVSGNNHSDDLFMFIKKKLTGLKPNTRYHVLFNVQFASNVPTGAVGIGGAPGESVFMKAGLTRVEPKKILDGDLYYRLNIDKGNQALQGADMLNIGHIGVAPNTTQYTTVFRNNNSNTPFHFTTDGTGEAWISIGTDSGFEGKTTLYYLGVDVLFNEIGPA